MTGQTTKQTTKRTIDAIAGGTRADGVASVTVQVTAASDYWAQFRADRAAKANRATKAQRPCACGCGATGPGTWRAGHDARAWAAIGRAADAGAASLEQAIAKTAPVGACAAWTKLAKAHGL